MMHPRTTPSNHYGQPPHLPCTLFGTVPSKHYNKINVLWLQNMIAMSCKQNMTHCSHKTLVLLWWNPKTSCSQFNSERPHSEACGGTQGLTYKSFECMHQHWLLCRCLLPLVQTSEVSHVADADGAFMHLADAPVAAPATEPSQQIQLPEGRHSMWVKAGRQSERRNQRIISESTYVLLWHMWI